jgi:hypothetical protein
VVTSGETRVRLIARAKMLFVRGGCDNSDSAPTSDLGDRISASGPGQPPVS